MAKRVRWVPVKTYGAVFMAEMAVGLLEDAGIPALVRGEYVGIFGGAWSGTVPKGVDALVPETFVAEAREVLELDEEAD